MSVVWYLEVRPFKARHSSLTQCNGPTLAHR